MRSCSPLVFIRALRCCTGFDWAIATVTPTAATAIARTVRIIFLHPSLGLASRGERRGAVASRSVSPHSGHVTSAVRAAYAACYKTLALMFLFLTEREADPAHEIGRASCRERV